MWRKLGFRLPDVHARARVINSQLSSLLTVCVTPACRQPGIPTFFRNPHLCAGRITRIPPLAGVGSGQDTSSGNRLLARTVTLRKASKTVTFTHFYALRTLFVNFRDLLGVLRAFLLTFALLFQNIPPRTPLSGKPNLDLLTESGPGRNDPVLRQEYQPYPGPL